MPDLDMGTRINKAVRSWFKDSLKSTNKIYIDGESDPYSVIKFTMVELDLKIHGRSPYQAAKKRLNLTDFSSYVDLAEALIRVQLKSERAGNCCEMACTGRLLAKQSRICSDQAPLHMRNDRAWRPFFLSDHGQGSGQEAAVV